MAITIKDTQQTGNVNVVQPQPTGNVNVVDSPQVGNVSVAQPATPEQQPMAQPTAQTQSVAQPTLDAGLQQRVQATSGTLNANQNFVNAVVKAFQGRDATAEELSQYTGKSVDTVRQAFGATKFDVSPTSPVDVSKATSSTGGVSVPTQGVTTDDKTTAFVNSMKQVFQQAQAQPTPEMVAAQEGISASEAQLMTLLNKFGTKGQRVLELEGEAGLQRLNNQLTQKDAEINQKIAEFDLIDQRLANQPIPTPLIVGQQAQTKRMLAAEVAVLSAERAAIAGNLENAQNLVNRAIDLEFGDIEAQISAVQTFLDINQNKLTKAEAKQAEQTQFVLDSYKQLLNEQREDRKANLELKLRLAETGQNPNLINLNRSPEENLDAIGGLLGETTTDGVANAQEIAQRIFSGQSSLRVEQLPTDQRLAVDRELSLLRQQALDEGNVSGILRSSAGGKDVTDSFTQSFEKTINTIGQVEDLQKQIEGELTGPIVSIIRSNNPYDVKAQTIQAQLNAIVPNLARGVYGEVGVLTDNDIRTYSKTLPNLKNTEDVRDAILGITIKSIQRSIENKLITQANAGKDVSGFVQQYEATQNIVDNLLPLEMNDDLLNLIEKSGRSIDEVREVINNGYTPKQVRDFLSDKVGFNNVAPDTNIGNIQIGAGIAKRTNNPGNLVYIGQAGAKKDPQSRFAMFDTPEEGFRALINDIEAKKDPNGRLNSNSTLAEMISVYAPPSENATQTYIQQIASRLGVSPNTPIGQIPTINLAKEIARKESSTVIS